MAGKRLVRITGLLSSSRSLVLLFRETIRARSSVSDRAQPLRPGGRGLTPRCYAGVSAVPPGCGRRRAPVSDQALTHPQEGSVRARKPPNKVPKLPQPTTPTASRGFPRGRVPPLHPAAILAVGGHGLLKRGTRATDLQRSPCSDEPPDAAHDLVPVVDSTCDDDVRPRVEAPTVCRSESRAPRRGRRGTRPGKVAERAKSGQRVGSRARSE